MDANQVVTYNLLSNNDILHVDIGLEFDSPIAGGLSVKSLPYNGLLAGFAAVDIGGGRWAVDFNKFSLSVENDQSGDVSRDVKIVTSNVVMSPPGLVQMRYDLGEDNSVLSSTPPASTTTTPGEEKVQG